MSTSRARDKRSRGRFAEDNPRVRIIHENKLVRSFVRGGFRFVLRTATGRTARDREARLHTRRRTAYLSLSSFFPFFFYRKRTFASGLSTRLLRFIKPEEIILSARPAPVSRGPIANRKRQNRSLKGIAKKGD